MMNPERGIALSQLGRDGQARAAFERALQYSRAAPQSWERRLIERMNTFEDMGAVDIWESVVSMTK
jgi:predicted RNA polymerase sigma factor